MFKLLPQHVVLVLKKKKKTKQNILGGEAPQDIIRCDEQILTSNHEFVQLCVRSADDVSSSAVLSNYSSL